MSTRSGTSRGAAHTAPEVLRWRPSAGAAWGAAAPAVVVLAVVAAYHYSLRSLAEGLLLDSPLAYLGLVPLLSLAMAVAVRRRAVAGPSVADRQVDVIVGLPLVAAALVALHLLPGHLGSEYWLWRLDLLSLPLFVAGTCVLVLGTREAWRLRRPVGFLLLAWPVPWTALLDALQGPLVASTTTTLSGLLKVVPVATPLPGGEGLFAVTSPGGSFTVAVASACAGASSTLGFLLLGGALTTVLRGTSRQRATWLAAGALLVWSLNVLRILLVLVTGWALGEGPAIDGLHPVLGLVLFAVAMGVLVQALPRFGLAVDLPAHPPAPSPRARSRRSALALAAVLVGTSASGAAANADLARHEQVVSPYGRPLLTALGAAAVAPSGWSLARAGDYPWAQRYFGADATWQRLLLTGEDRLPATMGPHVRPVVTRRSDRPGPVVSVDVVGTGSRRALSAFGVAACYGFHRYDVRHRSEVDLVGGVTGQIFSYRNPKDGRDRTTLAWEWPVQVGDERRYERVVLTVVDDAQQVPTLGGSRQRVRAAGAAPAHRAFLTRFARALVQEHVAAATRPDPRLVGVRT